MLAPDGPNVARQALLGEEAVELLEVRDVGSIDRRVGPAAGAKGTAVGRDRVVDRVGGQPRRPDWASTASGIMRFDVGPWLILELPEFGEFCDLSA